MTGFLSSREMNQRQANLRCLIAGDVNVAWAAERHDIPTTCSQAIAAACEKAPASTVRKNL